MFFYTLSMEIIHLYPIRIAKSGSVWECQKTLKEFHEFHLTHSIGNPNIIHSILGKLTEAGFVEPVELKEESNII